MDQSLLNPWPQCCGGVGWGRSVACSAPSQDGERQGAGCQSVERNCLIAKLGVRSLIILVTGLKINWNCSFPNLNLMKW